MYADGFAPSPIMHSRRPAVESVPDRYVLPAGAWREIYGEVWPRKVLLAGGPWCGRIVAIADRRDFLHVPVMRPVRFIRESDPDPLASGCDIVEYRPSTYEFGNPGYPQVWCVEGTTHEEIVGAMVRFHSGRLSIPNRYVLPAGAWREIYGDTRDYLESRPTWWPPSLEATRDPEPEPPDYAEALCGPNPNLPMYRPR